MVAVGIDLGTTYSLAAVVRRGEVEVVPNRIGELLTPSAVAMLPSGDLVVGAAARAQRALAPSQAAVSFKKDMGTGKTISVGERSFTAVELSALVLASLKDDVEAALGERISDAVITVPAYFGEAQRLATVQAAKLAGIPCERIINEPTAAGLAYGLAQRTDTRAVVLDLGGGTFDVSVLEILDGVVEITASAGDIQLGGDDFSRLLGDWLAQVIAREHDTALEPATMLRVHEAAEGVKHRLSTDDVAALVMPRLLLGKTSKDVVVEVDRATAERLWQPLLSRMRALIARALRDARALPSAIETVLLVGGSTRIPCVQQLAADIFGRLPSRTLPPDEAIARGAAVQAALKTRDRAVGDLVVTDIAPFSLGVEVAGGAGGRLLPGFFAPIIERGTTLPVSKEERFFTVADKQTKLDVEVFQGERATTKDNTHLGTLKVTGIPKGPAGQAIDIRFSYDLNSILDVDVTIVATGAVVSTTIDRSKGTLSAADLSKAKARLAALKIHPRDALPNTTAKMRAEALFAEVTGEKRRVLGAHIAAFAAALDSKDVDVIEHERAVLIEVTKAIAGTP